MNWDLFWDIVFFIIVITGVFVEIYQIKKIAVTHRISPISKILLIVGAIIIIAISALYGQNIVHYLIGGAGAILILLSENIYGATRDALVYPATGRFIKVIGKKSKFNEVKNIRIINKNNSEIMIKFIDRGSEQSLKFCRKDREQLEKLF